MRLCANCARKDTTCVSTSAATAGTRRSGSKCTMASVSTLGQANHAKTEWRRGIDPRNGETEKRRMGESASLARLCVLSYANDPFLRVIDHSHQLTEDVFARVVDFLEFRVPDIAMANANSMCTCVSAA